MQFNNPIVKTFVGFGGALLILSVFAGVNPLEVLQLIAVPYTYDISNGLGQLGARIFAGAMLATQALLVTLIALGNKTKNESTKRFIWVGGVILVVAYFVVLSLGFLLNLFH
ncbi:MAG: hypothetical protein RJQ07_04380 [Pseudomonadales bacterium]